MAPKGNEALKEKVRTTRGAEKIPQVNSINFYYTTMDRYVRHQRDFFGEKDEDLKGHFTDSPPIVFEYFKNHVHILLFMSKIKNKMLKRCQKTAFSLRIY